MKIWFDNIIFSLQRAGGISIVWNNLISNISNITTNIRFTEYSDATNNIFRKYLEIDDKTLSIVNHSPSLLDHFRHPIIESDTPYIFHSSYFRTSKHPLAINVTTVHDFIYEQGKPNLKQKIRIHLNYKAIRNSDAVVCISENTKKDLFKFIPDIDPKKVYVIYNGVSEEYKLLDKKETYIQYKDYILFVGGRQGYKNFYFVIDCIKDTNYKLLICGSPLSEKETSTLEQILPNRYKNIIFPTNQELNIIYNSVYALAYPSSYEGFGIPILEAQRAGCPVIVLNASSIPEVIGDTPLLMNELSKDCFIDKLNLLQDRKIRENIIEAGLVNSKRFSWERMATEYYNLYNYLLKNKAKI